MIFGQLRRLRSLVGGPARFRVIALLALVLGLDSANTASVGATALPLQRAFDLSSTDIGLLVTISSGVGAVATLPFGLLVDRVNRVRLLWGSVLAWSAAMAASGFAPSFAWLVFSRIALGAVVAVAGPVVASLVGDLFNPGERGRIYGFVLSGELLGSAVGLLISGNLAAFSWRLAFLWLAVLGVAVAIAVAWLLVEPARGGQSRIPLGAEELIAGADVEDSDDAQDSPGIRDEAVATQVSAQKVRPHRNLVLHEDPTGKSLWWAVRYVLAIRTNRVLLLASAFGYFYLNGLQVFAVEFLRGQYKVGQHEATLLFGGIGCGALVGVLITGRVADRLVSRGHISARMATAGIAFIESVVFLVPALAIHDLALTVLLAFFASFGLGGANPPLDAARLDIMHSRLWGRAESIRTLLRSAFSALAPLAFGYVATLFGGQNPGFGRRGIGDTGLQPTFLLMLLLLLAAGIVVLRGTRRDAYPRDVATAVASERAT